jgi:signal transduction histidine kinase
LADHLDSLSDPDGHLSLPDILGASPTAAFRPVSGFLNRGYTTQWSWVRFSVQGKKALPKDWFLSVGPAALDHVTVYVQTGDNPLSASSYKEYVMGDHHPFVLRPVRHPRFVVPLELPNDTPRWVYIHLQTGSAHSFKGWIYSLDEFIYSSQLHGLMTGGFFGITLLVMVFNAIFAIRLRDNLYGYFAVYVLTLFITYLGVEGVLPLVWPSSAHLIADYFAEGGMAVSFFCFFLFAIRLFETKERFPFAHRYFQGTMVFAIIVFLGVPFNFYGKVAPFLVVNGLFLVFYLIWLSIGLCRKQVPAGRLFLIAFMSTNLGAVLQFLRLIGVMSVNWLTTYSLEIGTLLSMVLMSLALTERVRAAEEKAVNAARDAEEQAIHLAREMTVELRDEREKLKEALERQIRFVDLVSHEYRTPLAIIKANLDILRDRDSAAAARTESIGLMQRAITRLVEVVETSFGVSRLAEPSTEATQYERIEVADFLAEVCDEATALRRGVILNLPPETPTLKFVLADRSQLKTALFNLIDNAIKYGGKDNPIDIGLENDGREIFLSVTDRGPVLTGAELETFRLKFRRGSNSADQDGVGIGLYLVERIAAQYGGRLLLRSNDPHGMVSTLILPACS